MLYLNEPYYLTLLKRGDSEGLSWVFERYKSPIMTFTTKFLKQPDLAEEATADVFIKIWEKRNIIDPSRGIKPLLYKIAKDITFNYLKKIASNERLKEKFLEFYQLADTNHGEKLYLKKEYTAQISNIVNDLPPQRRTIFKLKYFEGKNNQDIATQLNLSIHTVKSQLSKARFFVREKLQLNKELFVWILWLMGEGL